ncbi:hypothetical protein ILUMI_17794, partial [Ignelater luminosus]
MRITKSSCVKVYPGAKRQRVELEKEDNSLAEFEEQIAQLETGTSTQLMRNLAVKVQHICREEKQCLLTFDFMKVRKNVEYNSSQDIIEGFEDLGHIGRGEDLPPMLWFSWSGEYFTNGRFPWHGRKIYAMYDIPQLIKGVRNNLMEKKVLWRDIKQAYLLDRSSTTARAENESE